LIVAYRGGSHTWETEWSSDEEHSAFGFPIGPLARHAQWVVYDSINERMVIGGGEARMGSTDPVWVKLDDVWAFETDGGSWLELVAPSP
jgi:hypothetical protein